MIRSQGGFTIIEIMVVVIIIAGLAAIVAPNIMSRMEEANNKLTRTNIANLESSLKLFKLDNGFYPNTQQGLAALVEVPSVGRKVRKWKGPYVEKGQLPLDAWSNEFIYMGPEKSDSGRIYTVISQGEDGILNTEDDISSNDLQ